jgi:predicted homoserine dehydrogenase-like protein
MSSLKERLKEREETIGALKIGLIGSGQMGTGLINQTELMYGMNIVATADVMPGRAEAAYEEAGVDASLVEFVENDVAKANELIKAGKRVATQSSDFLVQIDELDAIVECTGIPEVGAIICEAAINAGKDVINMNVETDATIGYYLTQKAEEAGVVYSLVAGDEPGSIRELYDFADALGFEIVTIGKGKNNPLNRASNPDTAAEKAKRQQMSPKMLASFEDGTKTMVEMTSVGNSTGFVPEVRGAHGPNCSVEDLPKVFSLKENGGVFDNKGCVDYGVGVAPGVFIIITTDQPKIMRDLNYLSVSHHGNYWCLYRPYHMANLETPITIAGVCLDGRETLKIGKKPVCETITVAKRDLKAGEKIDTIGGYTVYGMIEKTSVSHPQNLLPLGISYGAVLKNDVAMGEAVSYDDVELNEDLVIVKLRREQDKMVYGE